MDKYKIENINFYQRTTLNIVKLSILFTPLVAYKYVDRYLANQEAWLILLMILSSGVHLIGFLREENKTYQKNKIPLPLVLLIVIFVSTLSCNICIFSSFIFGT